MRERVTLTVEVNLDPVPGMFYVPEDYAKALQAMLDHAYPWYSPVVTLVTPARLDN